MCHQNNLRFYNDIAYDKQYSGLILDGFEGNLPLFIGCMRVRLLRNSGDLLHMVLCMFSNCQGDAVVYAVLLMALQWHV